MAFSKKTWVDRESEYPARRTLTPAGGGEGQLYDAEPAQGPVLEAADASDALTMNDLEQRVERRPAERVTHALHNGRNLLINGNFPARQRGLSIPPTGASRGPDH